MFFNKFQCNQHKFADSCSFMQHITLAAFFCVRIGGFVFIAQPVDRLQCVKERVLLGCQRVKEMHQSWLWN